MAAMTEDKNAGLTRRIDAVKNLGMILAAPSPAKSQSLIGELFDRGGVTLEFIKTMQHNIDLCVERNELCKASKLMRIYETVDKRINKSKRKSAFAKGDEPLKKFTKLEKAKKQLALLFNCEDVRLMKNTLTTMIKSDDLDFDLFEELVSVNLDVANTNNWTTKVKVLEMIQASLRKYREQKSADVSNGYGQFHAPSFTHRNKGTEMESDTKHALLAEAMNLIVDVRGLSELMAGDGKRSSGSGKKQKKKAKQKGWEHMNKVDMLAKHLMEFGYAICDSFISLECCQDIRSEMQALEPYFEKSEIWVGKSNEVGAHVTVPSVRGDKVLWMCGGHKNERTKQFDSAGVQPQTRGDVAPCKPALAALAFKGQMALGHFPALKRTMKAIDKLVFDKLSRKVPSLSGITERSDVMVANYNNGGRFQSHIDNTTSDGRKLTVLCYLNPTKWKESDGGHLRIHPEGGGAFDIAPEGGRLVMFFSDKIEHEVRPTYGERYSFTMWYFDFKERMDAVDRAKSTAAETGVGNHAMTADLEAQNAAQSFMNAFFDDEGMYDASGLLKKLTSVKEKAKNLSPVALDIVGGILGVKSKRTDAAIDELTPDGYAALRSSFGKMGV
jgi:hypothetical protein